MMSPLPPAQSMADDSEMQLYYRARVNVSAPPPRLFTTDYDIDSNETYQPKFDRYEGGARLAIKTNHKTHSHTPKGNTS